jgi:hypothetical protein
VLRLVFFEYPCGEHCYEDWDKKQTRIAAIEAFARAMPVTWAMKKNVIPARASRIRRRRSPLAM